MNSEARRKRRARTRLRPGKLLSPEGSFLCDCAITDRSEHGARLRFFAAPELAPSFLLFDEPDGTSQPARLIWASGLDAGVGFTGSAEPLAWNEKERVAGRYYAVR